MAARIEQGVLLNVIHDHELRGITYEDNIERTTETDLIPDPGAESWTSGGMTVYNVDNLSGDRQTYPYSPLGTFNNHNGHATFYLSTNSLGAPVVMIDDYDQSTGATTTTTAYTLPTTLISCEIALTGRGSLARSTVDPNTFNLTGQANKHLRWTYYVGDAVKTEHTSLTANRGGSFRIEPAKELEGTKLGDAEEIIVET